MYIGFIVPWVLTTAAMAQQSETAPASRKFVDVLNELLNEVSYDLKTEQIRGFKTASVRKVSLSENIPKTYETLLENHIHERIRTHSKIKVIQCPNCRVRRSVVENNRITVTSPINNPAELEQISSRMGIEVWWDIALLYQETNMILAVNIIDAKTKELIWNKTYNSEKTTQQNNTSSSTGISIDTARDLEDATNRPSGFVIGMTTGIHYTPNVNKSSFMLGLNLRISEQFNDKKSEIGALIATMISPDLIFSQYGAKPAAVDGETTPETVTTVDDLDPFNIGILTLATFNYNFGDQTLLQDRIRHSAQLGGGAMLAQGYITGVGRIGHGLRFGRRFTLESAFNYHFPTSVTVGTLKLETKGGIGADVTFGLQF